MLEKVVEINPELVQRVKETTKTAFLDYLVQHRSAISMTNTLPIWEMLQLVKAKVALVNADIDSFQSVLEIPSRAKGWYNLFVKFILLDILSPY